MTEVWLKGTKVAGKPIFEMIVKKGTREIAREVITPASPLFSLTVKEAALWILRSKESMLEQFFVFKTWEEMKNIPVREEEMKEAAEELKLVREAIKEIESWGDEHGR